MCLWRTGGRCVGAWQSDGERKCGKIVRVQRAADRHPAWQERRCERGRRVKLQRMCGLITGRKRCQTDVQHLCISHSVLLYFCSNLVSPQQSVLGLLSLTLTPGLLLCSVSFWLQGPFCLHSFPQPLSLICFVLIPFYVTISDFKVREKTWKAGN